MFDRQDYRVPTKLPESEPNPLGPLQARRWTPGDGGVRAQAPGMWGGNPTPSMAGWQNIARFGNDAVQGAFFAGHAREIFGVDGEHADNGRGPGANTAKERHYDLDDVHYASDRVGRGPQRGIPSKAGFEIIDVNEVSDPGPKSYTDRRRGGGLAAAPMRALGPGSEKPAGKKAGGPPPSPGGGDSPMDIDMRTPEGKAKWASLNADPKNIRFKPK